jgi:hypothetical protein
MIGIIAGLCLFMLQENIRVWEVQGGMTFTKKMAHIYENETLGGRGT